MTAHAGAGGRLASPAPTTARDADAERAGAIPLLAGMLLPRDDRHLVAAVVGPRDRAHDAWSSWTARAAGWTDPQARPGRLAKALAPVVIEAIARSGLPVARDGLAALRAWRLAEIARRARYDAILHDALSALATTRVPFLVVGGAAFAVTLYDDATPRHCHDIDVVVPHDGAAIATDALRQAGFDEDGGVETARRAHLWHRAGLPLVVRHGVVHDVPGAIAFEALRASAHVEGIGGIDAGVLGHGHALVLACLPALTARHRIDAARALVDAARLVARLDEAAWADAIDAAGRHGVVSLLRATLHVARHDAALPIPSWVDDRLRSSAAAEDPARLYPLLAGAPRSAAALKAAARGWRTRAHLATAMAFPPAVQVAQRGESLGGVALAIRYARRLARWGWRGASEA